jgi:flavin-dependent dehydrogenase
VPAEEGTVRVGLATGSGREAGRLLGRFLNARFPKAQVVRQVGGLIPIGPPERTQGGRVLLVGDAAGQVKPTSGGGLYFLALCAGIAGEFAARGPEALPDYESRWRDEIGAELAFGLRARRVLARLSDQDIDRALAALDDPQLLSFLAQTADVDHPSRLVSAVLGRPRLWARFLPLVDALGGWARLRGLLSGLP